MDVAPLVDRGRLPAKATVGEPLPVTASVFREGHDQLAAEVVLTDPAGNRRAPVRMVKHGDVPDRYRAWVTPDTEGPGRSRSTPGPTRWPPGPTTPGSRSPPAWTST